MNSNVLFIGDSRRMKGGVSTVMKTLESSSLWNKRHCYWLETQVNASKAMKVAYLFMSFIKGLFVIPRYAICHFQTTPGPGMLTLLPIFLYTLLWRRKIVVQLHMGNQIKAYAGSRLFRFWARHSDCFVFLGQTWEKEIKPFLPTSLRTEYLYNPVARHKLETAFEKYFLYAAYFTPNKGYDVLIKAFSRVLEKHPDWKLVMCGSGDISPALKLVEELKISANVSFPGWVTGEKKENIFRHAFAYCMTSYQEGLPMTVLESMSFGIPAITTPVGCLPEVLQDRRSAIFFDFGNDEALSQVMLELIENRELRSSISQEAHKTTCNLFAIEAFVEKLEGIYAAL